MRIIPSIRSLLFALVVLAMSAASFAQIGVSINMAPPALPVYEQPPVPAQGYLWTPGYWAYGQGDYFWVPGTWVMAPQPGFLWTPGYWGWGNGGYAFNEGYWGPHVGFYGGINYGFGYGGQGYEGGRWNNGQFEYNRSVNNVNVTNIHNTYNTTVINNTTVNRVSYNGGNGGVTARPTPQEETAAHEKHVAPVAAQTQQVEAARANPQQRASVNQGKPAIAATPKPGAFSAGVAAKEAGAPYKATENKAAENKATENKAAENKATENKAAENKPLRTRQPRKGRRSLLLVPRLQLISSLRKHRMPRPHLRKRRLDHRPPSRPRQNLRMHRMPRPRLRRQRLVRRALLIHKQRLDPRMRLTLNPRLIRRLLRDLRLSPIQRRKSLVLKNVDRNSRTRGFNEMARSACCEPARRSR